MNQNAGEILHRNLDPGAGGGFRFAVAGENNLNSPAFAGMSPSAPVSHSNAKAAPAESRG